MTDHRMRVPLAVLAGCLTLMLGACASSGQPQQPATSATSSAAASSPAGSPSILPPTGTAAGPGAVTTLTGTVQAGVESQCVVLVDASGTVLANLLGFDLTAHPLESEVEVTGTFEPDLMTTCQQGTPFEVVTVVAR